VNGIDYLSYCNAISKFLRYIDNLGNARKSDPKSMKVKKVKRQTSEIGPNIGLEALFKTRFHGAVNIRGIRYQILYSLLRAFDLYNNHECNLVLRLEGIEDIDLLGLHLGNEYIQVKSSQNPWNWSKLKEPIKGFLEVHRSEPLCNFVLVVNFQLQKELSKLASRETLPQVERQPIEKKFRDLCKDIGASIEESNDIYSRLTIISKPEELIRREIRRNMADTFEVGSEAIDTYILAFIAKFLEWAKDRKSVTRTDLDSIRIAVGEALSSESEFQAHGRGLIGRISWEPDRNIADFFDGKETRPGHIAANIDIRRSGWLEKVDSAICSSKICILRSSSGQGKSALLYRYAYEKWPAENTFILRKADSEEQVELIRRNLHFRANLGLPILLLVDNAECRTRLWPLIAQECAALGIRTLISVRNEDWHRFALESLTNYEILEPILDSNEAKDLFNAFRAEGRLHASVDSPEWAYEKVGKPHLLMEYVYFITHGQMLKERLRDQVKQFSAQQEDPAKMEILRRIALADALGASVIAEKLLRTIRLRDDPQLVLKSLTGEYLNIDHGIITGLHWIRSDHIAHILHEGYPDPVSTALTIIDAISTKNTSEFISNAISMRDLDTDMFIKGLIEKAKNANIDIILDFIDGIYKAGEKQFFEKNRELFDEAYDLCGYSGAVSRICCKIVVHPCEP